MILRRIVSAAEATWLDISSFFFFWLVLLMQEGEMPAWKTDGSMSPGLYESTVKVDEIEKKPVTLSVDWIGSGLLTSVWSMKMSNCAFPARRRLL